MTSTVFVDKQTSILAPWLNDVNQRTYLVSTTTATQGQTVVTVATYSNHLLVFRNGLLQAITTDYTESSSTTITFTSGLSAGDTITIHG